MTSDRERRTEAWYRLKALVGLNLVRFPQRPTYRQLGENRGPATVVVLPLIRIERPEEPMQGRRRRLRGGTSTFWISDDIDGEG